MTENVRSPPLSTTSVGCPVAAVPVITIIGEEKANPPKALFTLTPAGRNMMEGKIDFVEINNPSFWLGGTHLPRERMWRWDGERRQIVPSQPAAS